MVDAFGEGEPTTDQLYTDQDYQDEDISDGYEGFEGDVIADNDSAGNTPRPSP